MYGLNWKKEQTLTRYSVTLSWTSNRARNLGFFLALLLTLPLAEPVAVAGSDFNLTNSLKNDPEDADCPMTIYSAEGASKAPPPERLRNISPAMVSQILSPVASDTADSDRLGDTDSALTQKTKYSLALSPPLHKVKAETADQANQIASEKIAIGLPASSILGGVEKTEIVRSNSPIVIDSDETAKNDADEHKQLKTSPDKTRIIVGAKFPVVLASQLNSKTAKAGDLVEAHLKYDLSIGERLVAEAGSLLLGHIDYALKARTAMRAIVSSERWYKNGGCLGITFDEVVNAKGEHLPLLAKPAQQGRVIKNNGEGRLLGVNRIGQLVEPWSNQLKNKAIRIGLHAAMVPAGVFSFGAMPVALGVMGAANPSFAYMNLLVSMSDTGE